MKSDTIKAKKILEDGNHTCVITGNDILITDNRRGVAPLLDFYDKGVKLTSCCAADKVVGKAAAMLYVLLDITEVFAYVISRGAAEVFEKYSVSYHADCIVERISNRAKTGFCPMETAVQDIDNPDAAVTAIRKRIKELTGGI